MLEESEELDEIQVFVESAGFGEVEESEELEEQEELEELSGKLVKWKVLEVSEELNEWKGLGESAE